MDFLRAIDDIKTPHQVTIWNLTLNSFSSVAYRITKEVSFGRMTGCVIVHYIINIDIETFSFVKLDIQYTVFI